MAAVWQRTAKRAPKLACFPSVISKFETKPINPTDVDDSFAIPRLSDSKWWLQLQSDYIHQRGLTGDQVNALESRNPHRFVENQDDGSINIFSSLSSNEFCESDSKWWLQLQTDCVYQKGFTNDQVNQLESRYRHGFVKNRDDGSISNVNSLSSKESYEFVKLDSVEIPRWQVAETDDLGSFVSKNSRILIESCDLYRPMHTGLEPTKVKCGQHAISQHDTSKGKLLEALCHSQTRAREAEVAVKKAYEEKEHVIKLLLRQAAQLFAYRQWIYVLQIENLCYQMKNYKSDSIPPAGAFSSSNIGKLDNRKTVVAAKGKRIPIERGLGRYAVVFVVGLGIVGAGLVLGWTIGWMLI